MTYNEPRRKVKGDCPLRSHVRADWFQHFTNTKFYLLELYPNHIQKDGTTFFFDVDGVITYVLLETKSNGMNRTKLISYNKAKNRKGTGYRLQVKLIRVWIHTVFSSSLMNIDDFDRLLEGHIDFEKVEEMRNHNPVEDLVVYSFFFARNRLVAGFTKEYFLVHDGSDVPNMREEKMRFDEMVYSFRGEYEGGLQPYFSYQCGIVTITKRLLGDFAKEDEKREMNQDFYLEDGVLSSST